MAYVADPLFHGIDNQNCVLTKTSALQLVYLSVDEINLVSSKSHGQSLSFYQLEDLIGPFVGLSNPTVLTFGPPFDF